MSRELKQPNQTGAMRDNSTNTTANGTKIAEDYVGKDSANVAELYAVPLGVVNGLLILATLWLLVFFIGYVKQANRFNRTASGMLHVACLIAVLTALLRFIVDEVIFFSPRIQGALDHCELLIDVSSTFSAIAITSSYVFLWMRQKAIYAGNKFAKSHRGGCIRILSSLTLAMLLTLAVALSAGYILSSSFTSSEKGCVYKSVENRTEATIKWDATKRYALGGYLFFTQAALLSLFIYPLLRLRAKRQKSNDIIRRHRKDKISATIKRSILCAIVASFSDLLTVFLMVVVPRGSPIFVSSSIYNISTEINIICVLATFGTFRRKLSRKSRRPHVPSKPILGNVD